MFLNSIMADPERFDRIVEIARSSLLPLVERALLHSVPLAVLTFAIGLIIAILTALARISKIGVLDRIARIYISIIRGTPLLVQLYIIFYGLPSIGITIDSYLAAVIGFSLNVGAYASEIVRASIQSIPKGQWEASYSIGMTYSQALKRVILPQAARVSIPPLSNTFIGHVKDTSLAALILVAEMFRKAQEIAAQTYEILLLYTEAALLYWIICFLLSIVQGRLERRLDRYVAK